MTKADRHREARRAVAILPKDCHGGKPPRNDGRVGVPRAMTGRVGLPHPLRGFAMTVGSGRRHAMTGRVGAPRVMTGRGIAAPASRARNDGGEWTQARNDERGYLLKLKQGKYRCRGGGCVRAGKFVCQPDFFRNKPLPQ